MCVHHAVLQYQVMRKGDNERARIRGNVDEKNKRRRRGRGTGGTKTPEVEKMDRITEESREGEKKRRGGGEGEERMKGDREVCGE